MIEVILPKTTPHHPQGTPSWHCGVPTDPARWRRVVTAGGEAAIRAEYTLAEFYLMVVLHPQVSEVVALHAMGKLVALLEREA